MDLPTSPIVTPKTRGTSALSIVLGVAVVVAVGGVAFAAGRLTAPPAAVTASTNGGGTGGAGNGGAGNGGNGGGRFGGGFGNGPGASGAPGGGLGRGLGATAGVTIEGTVSEIAADHITITLASGASLTIPVSSATTYHRQSDARATDVTSGAQVLVRVEGRGGPGNGPAGSPAPSGSPRPSGSPGPAGGFGQFLGSATDITVVTP